MIKIGTTVNAPINKVWTAWTKPEHIIKWNSASEDWHTPKAENDLRVGGSFSSRMEARDGSFGFDFEGTYTTIEPFKHIAYIMPDGRQVNIEFRSKGDTTKVITTFDPEDENPIDMQREGWQSILDNFKNYVERVYGNTNKH